MKKQVFRLLIALFLLMFPLLLLMACESKNDEHGLEDFESKLEGSSSAQETSAPDNFNPELESSNDTILDTDEEVEVTQYTVTYLAKFDELVLKEDVVTQNSDEVIVYSASEIIGYRFVGWSDSTSIGNRTDDYSKDGATMVALYEMEYLDMPIVIINTEGYRDITSKEEYIDCSISIVNTEETYCIDEVTAGIRGRGNSTWGFKKKPYRIKFDSKQSLFGSSYKQKSWTLLANYTDKSLSRNSIAYELGDQLDGIDFSSMHQFVEVYLNGDYKGVYILCDQMETGSGRVDVDEDLYDDGDTGYLLELDQRAPSEGVLNKDYFTVNGIHYAIKTPDTEDENYDPDIYVTYIRSYLQRCSDALNGEDWDQICSLMDIDSFVDAYIVTELFSNPDCSFSSFYMYKDRGGKLCCGPLWDFDLGAGNNIEALGGIYADEWNPDAPLYATANPWFKGLFKHQKFKDLVAERLVNCKSTILSVIDELSPVNDDGYYATYGKAFERNFERWSILDVYIWNNTQMICSIHTVKGQQLYLRDWLLTRYYFMLNEIG